MGLRIQRHNGCYNYFCVRAAFLSIWLVSANGLCSMLCPSCPVKDTPTADTAPFSHVSAPNLVLSDWKPEPMCSAPRTALWHHFGKACLVGLCSTDWLPGPPLASQWPKCVREGPSKIKAKETGMQTQANCLSLCQHLIITCTCSQGSGQTDLATYYCGRRGRVI